MALDLDEWLAYEPAKPQPTRAPGDAVVISIFNQKGGVGKTTSTVSLAAALAEFGRKVLVVDFDPQGSLTVGFTGNRLIEPTIYNVVMGQLDSLDVIVKTSVKGVDLLPAGIDLSAAEMQLVNEVGREFTLSRALKPLLGSYDYILIDCLPSLGLLAINALAASDGLIIPLQCEFFALKGLGLLERTLEMVTSRIHPGLKVIGVLPTMVKGVGHHREVLQMVIDNYQDVAFHSIIPETIKFSEATVDALPITAYASRSAAANAYRKAAAELIERLEVTA